MTGARRLAAIALCVGLAVGVTAGVIFDLPQALNVLGDSSDSRSGPRDTTQAAPVVPGSDERVQAAQDLLSARAAAVRTRSKAAWMATVDGSISSAGSAGSSALPPPPFASGSR